MNGIGIGTGARGRDVLGQVLLGRIGRHGGVARVAIVGIRGTACGEIQFATHDVGMSVQIKSVAHTFQGGASGFAAVRGGAIVGAILNKFQREQRGEVLPAK